MFTEEEIAEIMAKAKDELRANLAADMKEKMKASVEYILGAEVRKLIEEYVKDELMPDLKKSLLEDKPIILAAAIAAANELGDALATALIEDVKRKLGQEWTRKNIIKAVFD